MECLIVDCSEHVRTGGYCYYHAQTWGKFRRNGFDEATYRDLMLAAQCEICGKPGQMGGKNNRANLYADHDHSHCPEGKICPKCFRGLICNRCNGMLAGLDDKPWLRKAEKYLATHELNK